MSTGSEPSYYRCGVFGCILEEHHPGLCIMPEPHAARRVRREASLTTETVAADPPPPLSVRPDLCVPASAGSPLSVRTENGVPAAPNPAAKKPSPPKPVLMSKQASLPPKKRMSPTEMAEGDESPGAAARRSTPRVSAGRGIERLGANDGWGMGAAREWTSSSPASGSPDARGEMGGEKPMKMVRLRLAGAERKHRAAALSAAQATAEQLLGIAPTTAPEPAPTKPGKPSHAKRPTPLAPEPGQPAAKKAKAPKASGRAIHRLPLEGSSRPAPPEELTASQVALKLGVGSTPSPDEEAALPMQPPPTQQPTLQPPWGEADADAARRERQAAKIAARKEERNRAKQAARQAEQDHAAQLLGQAASEAASLAGSLDAASLLLQFGGNASSSPAVPRAAMTLADAMRTAEADSDAAAPPPHAFGAPGGYPSMHPAPAPHSVVPTGFGMPTAPAPAPAAAPAAAAPLPMPPPPSLPYPPPPNGAVFVHWPRQLPGSAPPPLGAYAPQQMHYMMHPASQPVHYYQMPPQAPPPHGHGHGHGAPPTQLPPPPQQQQQPQADPPPRRVATVTATPLPASKPVFNSSAPFPAAPKPAAARLPVVAAPAAPAPPPPPRRMVWAQAVPPPKKVVSAVLTKPVVSAVPTKPAVSAVPVASAGSDLLPCEEPRAAEPMTIDLVGSRDGSVDGCE